MGQLPIGRAPGKTTVLTGTYVVDHPAEVQLRLISPGLPVIQPPPGDRPSALPTATHTLGDWQCSQPLPYTRLQHTTYSTQQHCTSELYVQLALLGCLPRLSRAVWDNPIRDAVKSAAPQQWLSGFRIQNHQYVYGGMEEK